MKNIYISIIALFITSSMTLAQIPNAGFENRVLPILSWIARLFQEWELFPELLYVEPLMK